MVLHEEKVQRALIAALIVLTMVVAGLGAASVSDTREATARTLFVMASLLSIGAGMAASMGVTRRMVLPACGSLMSATASGTSVRPSFEGSYPPPSTGTGKGEGARLCPTGPAAVPGTTPEDQGDTVAAVNDIADRINLLALNAAIETARAEDAEKAFTSTVLPLIQLAGQTSRSAREIGEILQFIKRGMATAKEALDSTLAEEKGTDGLHSTGSALKEIGGSAKALQSMAERVSAAMEELNGAADSLGREIAKIRATAGEASQAAREAAREAARLNDLSEGL